ncbi:hypothetical protein LMG26689_04939 [Achromobacter animicus]|uniref:phage/plasmid replication protein, II/X family n=1 Tax=Achromobacter animicus TaxID=1389935 RepID=UPI0014673D11|nr:phage/plasmid replication protein, II/X family [Achromobacter animicus]CAB3909991.1 hypothetical protein LMG26689_04939 [Achromobacter animicus]
MLPVGASPRKKQRRASWPADRVRVRSWDVESETLAHRIEFDCCPPKVLQKHNFFGHADLRSYTYKIFRQQLDILGIRPNDEADQEWAAGQVGLTEIHLTANFWCPPIQTLIIDAIDENNRIGKMRDRETSISLGYGPKGRSVHHTATVYNKYEVLKKDWKAPGPFQKELLDLASRSIRVELKLHHQGLRERGLQYVSRWSEVDVDALFFELLSRKRIITSVQRLLSEDEELLLAPNLRRAYALWLKGESLNTYFSRTTVWSYARKVKELVGIDITADRRPQALPRADSAAIFTRENIVPIPTWAYGSPFYSPPDSERGQLVA